METRARRGEQQRSSAQRRGPKWRESRELVLRPKVTSSSANLAASRAALSLWSRHFRAKKPSPFDQSAFFPRLQAQSPSSLTASCAGIVAMLRKAACASPCFRTIHRHATVMTTRIAIHLALTIGRAHPPPCNQSCLHPDSYCRHDPTTRVYPIAPYGIVLSHDAPSTRPSRPS